MSEDQTSKKSPLSPVLRHVVAEELCVGCGACASICPVSCLQMSFNQFGEYNPVESEGCTQCGLCSKVCPFGPGNPNEDEIGKKLFGEVHGIGRRWECGFYHASFVGYSTVDNHRWGGASGGLATWTMETLLNNGMVDRIICASPNPDPQKLFRFVIVDNVEDLRQCSGSCFYPLEMSEVLKRVLEEDARYAIIALPCYHKALRLMKMVNPKLAGRLVYQLGLVCGLLPSKFYAEYVALMAGANPGQVKRLSFRDKDPNLPAANPLITYRYDFSSPEPDGYIKHLDGPCFAWGDWFFKHNACSFCDDVFAELADVVFMDAWLPEYASKPGGTSLVISRKTELTELIRLGVKNKEIEGGEIPIQRVIDSQLPVVGHKRTQLAAMLSIRSEQGGKRVPAKRVAPAPLETKQAMKNLLELESVRRQTREAWPHTFRHGLNAFYKAVPAFRLRARRRAWIAKKGRVRSMIGKLIKRFLRK